MILSNPIYLGTNLGFVSSGLSRFYEMTNVYDRGPVDINERSQQIQTQFGQGLTCLYLLVSSHKLVVYKRYTGIWSLIEHVHVQVPPGEQPRV